jgi:hypothetical protein
MRDTFIYALIDPITENVRYVGKSVVPYRRYISHVKEVKNAKRRKDRWINFLLKQNRKPLFVILEKFQDKNWQKYERKWIKFCKTQGYDLTNHTDGGDGLHNPDRETRKRMSESRKNLFENVEYKEWYRKNVLNDPERCRKISNKLNGRKKTKEHIEKLPQNNIGYKHKEGFGEKISKVMSGENNPMYGNHFNKIWKEKYGEDVAEKMLKQHYQERGEKQRGKIQEPQYDLLVKKYGKEKANIMYKDMNDRRSKKMIGIKRSEETKEKMRKSRRKWWENKRKNLSS